MKLTFCMSSIPRYRWPQCDRPGLVLHSLPNTERRRANGIIFLSRDDGQTWTKGPVIAKDGLGYSCLVKLPNGDIGCLYESGGYRSIEFVRIPFNELSR